MANENQNEQRDMGKVIDQAKGMSTGDLPSGDRGAEEAERTKRAVDSMSTGNVPHGGDDPQRGTQMTPMPTDTGGKGHAGDTLLPDQGRDQGKDQ